MAAGREKTTVTLTTCAKKNHADKVNFKFLSC